MPQFEQPLDAQNMGERQTLTTPSDTDMCSPTVMDERRGGPARVPGVKRPPVQRRVPRHTGLRGRRRKQGVATNQSKRADQNDKSDQEGRELPPSDADSALTRRAPSPSIVDLLSEGMLDPLYAAGLPIKKKREFELLDYVTNVVWRGFEEVDVVDGTPNPFPNRWIFRGTTDPAVLYACLMGASSHLDCRLSFRLKNNQIIPEQVYYQNISMRWLRTELENFESANLDNLLIVIMCLATSRLRHLPQPPLDPNPFCPPLRSLNWIDIYGGWDISGVHWDALMGLIKKNGGISAIKLYGLPSIIS